LLALLFVAVAAAAATVAEEVKPGTVTTISERAAVGAEESPFGGAAVHTVRQQGFLSASREAPRDLPDDGKAAGESEVELGAGVAIGGNETSAPGRRLAGCYPVGMPCFINAQCCSARCCSDHLCAPSLR